MVVNLYARKDWKSVWKKVRTAMRETTTKKIDSDGCNIISDVYESTN